MDDSATAKAAIDRFKGRKGWPKRRTLERYSAAHSLFQRGAGIDEVAGKTGWSARHLERMYRRWSEVFSAPPVVEAPAARFESLPRADQHILTQALQKHHERVLETLGDLSGIEPPKLRDPDLFTWSLLPQDAAWPIPKGTVSRQAEEDLIVKLQVEERPRWKLLRQHLSGHPLLGFLDRWKAAEAEDIEKRLGLIRRIIGDAERADKEEDLGLKVKLETGRGDYAEPFLTVYYAFAIYGHVIASATGQSSLPATEDQFRKETPGVLHLGGRPVIAAADDGVRQRAIDYLIGAQTKPEYIGLARDAVGAYQTAEDLARNIAEQLETFELMPVLPPRSVCDQCQPSAISE